jgi:hypothetical protein
MLWASVIAGILAVPLIAMQVTGEVAWDVEDFAFLGVLLTGLAIAYELIAARGSWPYRAGCALALAAVMLLLIANGAVGFIGDGGWESDLAVFGIIGVAALAAAIARLRPAGMAVAMLLAALAQVVAAAFSFAVHPDLGAAVRPAVFFVVLWLGAAALFHRAARA